LNREPLGLESNILAAEPPSFGKISAEYSSDARRLPHDVYVSVS